jgi:glycine betaine transporter
MIKSKTNKTVFYISLIIVFIIAGWGLFFSDQFANMANSLMSFLTINFGWLYLMSMFIFVIVAVLLGISKYGKIKLGPDDSEPEFSTKSWFGMLFGAGMGVGLVFWGAAEPMSHMVSHADLGKDAAAAFAMGASFKHWGFHPWANYSIIGLALGYFQYRKGYPGLISSIFVPLIGEKGANGPIGKTIDILAVFATISGVATTLGLGTLQINSGMTYVFGIPSNSMVQLTIIAVIAVVYIGATISGIEKGIKLLGDINLIIAGTVMLLTFLVGPKLIMLNSLSEGLGTYLNNFITDSFHINIFGDNPWLNSWTIFYWAWWIAWAPFVGSFIARISKGRTIREFVVGVIVAPSLVSMVWFAIFGGLGISLVDKIGIDKVAEAVVNPATALFVAYNQYGLSTVLSIITLCLLITFFVTSANSSTFVLGMFTSNGDLNPSKGNMALWGVVQAMLAAALLLSGGLVALQTASIAAAFPFIFIMLFACISIIKALLKEKV